MQRVVNNVIGLVLDGIFPQYCLLCGLRSGGSLPLCAPCRDCLLRNTNSCYRCALPLGTAATAALCGQCLQQPPAYDRTIAPFLYEEHLSYLIGRWKFHREHRLAALLATLWLDAATPRHRVDVLVPVPLHWRKLLWRGFNQAEQLCHQLQRQNPVLAAIPSTNSLARRKQATLAQTSLSAQARARNLLGAFTITRRCDNLRVAIIDDVMTTGATTAALAAALRAAGASYVEVWCLARTPAPPR